MLAPGGHAGPKDQRTGRGNRDDRRCWCVPHGSRQHRRAVHRIPVALPDSFLGTRTPVSSSRLVPRCNASTPATQSSSLHRSPMAPASLAGVAETGTAREETFWILRGKGDRPNIL